MNDEILHQINPINGKVESYTNVNIYISQPPPHQIIYDKQFESLHKQIIDNRNNMEVYVIVLILLLATAVAVNSISILCKRND